MKKSLILYSLSTALNKGAILLFFPLLTQFLTLEEFGKWSLIIIVSNLLIPMLSLNGTAGILREGSQNLHIGFFLLKKYIFISSIISLIFGMGVYLIAKDNWFFYSIFIGSAEALLLLSLTFIRTEGRALLYFIIILLKTLALLAVVLYARQYDLELPILAQYYIYTIALFALTSNIYLLFQYKFNHLEFEFKPIFIFGILLIPHGLSQWIMSSSDRLILEYTLGSYEVGVYSLAYNIALILMLINSAIALSIPPYMIKNIDRWKNENYDHKLITYYTVLSIVLFFIVISLYALDKRYTQILGYYGEEMILMIFFIYVAIYLLGLYYLYANYLFYHKQAIIISKTTLYAAIFNIVATVLFVYLFGTIGAALATLFAYIYYLYNIRKQTLKIEPLLQIPLMKNISIFLILTTIISLGFYNV